MKRVLIFVFLVSFICFSRLSLAGWQGPIDIKVMEIGSNYFYLIRLQEVFTK